jgi:integrase
VISRPTYGLRRSEWRTDECACWDKVIVPRLRCGRLRERSIRAYLYTYCTWLGHLRTVNRCERPTLPLDRPAPQIFEIFIGQIRARTSASTAFIEAQRLRRLLITFDGGADTAALDKIIDKLRVEIKSTPRLVKATVDTRILLAIGYGLMAAGAQEMSQEAAHSNDQGGAILWRDGFMIALLALRPLRIRNFANLRLQHDIILSEDIAWLRLSKTQTKTGQALQIPYPMELLPQLHQYVTEIRLRLLRESSPSQLWLSRRGLPMGEAVVRRIIKDRTAEALGHPISPHRFRHAAVTYLATMHPASIAVASDLLGHSHPAITEAYYNLTPPQQAATEVQKHLIDEAKRARARTARALKKTVNKQD